VNGIVAGWGCLVWNGGCRWCGVVVSVCVRSRMMGFGCGMVGGCGGLGA